MDTDDRSIDELIEIAEEIPDRLGLSAGMAELRGSAQGEGVSVTVDVQGMLVELEITDRALALGPERLAAEISRLSTEAGNNVLQAGLKAIRAGCGPDVATAIAGYFKLDDAPSPPAPAPAPPGRSAARPSPPDDDSEGFVLRPV